MADNDESLGDQQTYEGGAQPVDSSDRSLGNQSTFGGGTDSSLSDIGGLTGDAELDMEIVDLSRYEVQETLGKGGMGEVLLATDTRLNRKVAIKRMLGDATRSQTAVRRFLTEAQSIAALNHFNIVQIYDYGRDKDGPFLIMEYVDGGSLLDKCREGALPLEDAVELACQLCDGLSKAHEANIIHRDIKPANVLLTTDGIPKLTDFGLARQDTGDTGQTMAGAVLGTLDFMPPEQRLDATQTDNRSDLWSLAATLYQMLTGEPPRVIDLDAVPQELRQTLARALKSKKNDRYQTAGEFRDALQGCLTAAEPAPEVAVDLGAGECPKCHTKNEATRKFCRGCGESLRVSCLSCSGDIPVWENFCADCGGNQKEVTSARRAELDTQREQAESLRKEYAFDKSLDIAQEIAAVEDSRLQHLKEWVETFIAETGTEKVRQKQDAQGHFAESQTHCGAYDYPAAIRALETIPEPMRTSEMSDYLQQLQSDHEESEDLIKTISKRVQKRDLQGLLEQVDRAIELRGDRADLQKLRSRLLERQEKLDQKTERQRSRKQELLDSVELALGKAQLNKAEKTLQTISTPVFDDERFQSLQGRVSLQQSLGQELKPFLSVDLDLESFTTERLSELLTKTNEFLELSPDCPLVSEFQSRLVSTLSVRTPQTTVWTWFFGEMSPKRAKKLIKIAVAVIIVVGVVCNLIEYAYTTYRESHPAIVQPIPPDQGGWISAADSQAITEALQQQEWNQALAIDAQNVPALLGRANQRLNEEPPNIKGALRDLELVELIEPSAMALESTKTLAAEKRAEQERILAEQKAEQERILAKPPLTNSLGMAFKLIPAGTFTMGDANGSDDETPHQVTLTKGFELGVYEVTQAQYEKVMKVTNPSQFKGPRNAVEKVSWTEAVEFCRKLSELPAEKSAGYVYRLPTEAEWEYACRAGTTTKYSFGDSVSELSDYAWHNKNSGGTPHPVGGKKPNAFGLYDMHGNVYEWCHDYYGADYYKQSPEKDPTGPASGSIRMVRGGSWSSDCRSATRDRYTSNLRINYVGFRVLRSSIK